MTDVRPTATVQARALEVQKYYTRCARAAVTAATAIALAVSYGWWRYIPWMLIPFDPKGDCVLKDTRPTGWFGLALVVLTVISIIALCASIVWLFERMDALRTATYNYKDAVKGA